jgi:hypothetical protein
MGLIEGARSCLLWCVVWWMIPDGWLDGGRCGEGSGRGKEEGRELQAMIEVCGIMWLCGMWYIWFRGMMGVR